MNTELLYFIGLFLIPLAITFLAGYGKLQPGPFLGLGTAGGAFSSFLTYLLIDFESAAIQFGALILGGLLYVGTIGLFGEKFSYRSPMVLFSAIALFPFGLIIGQMPLLTSALWTYGALTGAGIAFALLLALARKNMIGSKSKLSKPRFIMVVPVLVGISIGFLISFSAIYSS